jgi:hypothetical protein
MNTKAFLAALLLFLLAQPADAFFHRWRITEIYSNAEGTVQYAVLLGLADGNAGVGGHDVRATGGGVTRRFTLPRDLPADSGERRMLIGTQGFAALGGVQPDYIVPNGFLTTPAGTIDWADGSDTWNYSGLPTDGALALARDGTTRPNAPTNYAGVTAPVKLYTAAASYEGLWWKSPAGSENGWGLNLEHQGDILFGTWFTYDTDGSSLWLVLPSAPKGDNGAYSGPLYRPAGPSFSTQPWNGSQVVLTPVGNASLSFSGEKDGTFSFTVNGVTRTKAITRMEYAARVPKCSTGGPPPDVDSYQGLWWKSPAGSESGWGINLTHQGDILFGTWFTYGDDGKGAWFVMPSVPRVGTSTTFSGPIYRGTGPAFSGDTWDASRVKLTEVGTATFIFHDAYSGNFRYTVGDLLQAKSITRLVYALPATFCH